jgi:hypothetical protein
MRRLAPLSLFLAAALAVAACGGDGDDPKRAVDARTEALHFFAADQPFVALLDTSTPNRLALARTVRALASSPALSAFASGGGAFVGRSGLDLGRLAELLTDDDPEDGLAASQAAYGIKPSGAGSEVLIVLVSEQVDEMESEAEAVAISAGMTEGDEIASARVFSDGQAALAVRDGVVALAPDLPALRSAIALRDADQDEQLDEDRISGVLADLPSEPPLVAYMNLAALRDTDPGLFADILWLLRSIDEAGIGITPGAAAMRVDIVAEIEEDGLRPGELRDDRVDEIEAHRIVGGRRVAGNEFRNAILALAPFSANTVLDDDELRATVLGSR